MLRFLALPAALGALLVAGAAPALAASPPKGRYGCVIGSDALYAGDLYILGGGKYRLNKSRTGRFTTKGRQITWRTGVFKGLWSKSRWYMTTEHRAEISFTSRKSGYTTEYCTFEKRL